MVATESRLDELREDYRRAANEWLELCCRPRGKWLPRVIMAARARRRALVAYLAECVRQGETGHEFWRLMNTLAQADRERVTGVKA
jgi:hypothetical protein